MPEPPSHVEEGCVSGRGRELPEHVHVCLGQGVPLDIAARAEVLVQGLHPGCLVTNAQDGPVVGSCKDRGTWCQLGAEASGKSPGRQRVLGVNPSPDMRCSEQAYPEGQQTGGCLERGKRDGERFSWSFHTEKVLELDRGTGCTILH